MGMEIYYGMNPRYLAGLFDAGCLQLETIWRYQSDLLIVWVRNESVAYARQCSQSS